MIDLRFDRRLSVALFALRLTLGIFLLQWGIEKFVVPATTASIFEHFYGMPIGPRLGYAFGAVEIAIAVCLILGLAKTATSGAALLLHTVTVLVSWRQLIDPWGSPGNHLFVASVPVLGGFIALFLLRDFPSHEKAQSRDRAHDHQDQQ